MSSSRCLVQLNGSHTHGWHCLLSTLGALRSEKSAPAFNCPPLPTVPPHHDLPHLPHLCQNILLLPHLFSYSLLHLPHHPSSIINPILPHLAPLHTKYLDWIFPSTVTVTRQDSPPLPPNTTTVTRQDSPPLPHDSDETKLPTPSPQHNDSDETRLPTPSPQHSDSDETIFYPTQRSSSSLLLFDSPTAPTPDTTIELPLPHPYPVHHRPVHPLTVHVLFPCSGDTTPELSPAPSP